MSDFDFDELDRRIEQIKTKVPSGGDKNENTDNVAENTALNQQNTGFNKNYSDTEKSSPEDEVVEVDTKDSKAEELHIKEEESLKEAVSMMSHPEMSEEPKKVESSIVEPTVDEVVDEKDSPSEQVEDRRDNRRSTARHTEPSERKAESIAQETEGVPIKVNFNKTPVVAAQPEPVEPVAVKSEAPAPQPKKILVNTEPEPVVNNIDEAPMPTPMTVTTEPAIEKDIEPIVQKQQVVDEIEPTPVIETEHEDPEPTLTNFQVEEESGSMLDESDDFVEEEAPDTQQSINENVQVIQPIQEITKPQNSMEVNDLIGEAPIQAPEVSNTSAALAKALDRQPLEEGEEKLFDPDAISEDEELGSVSRIWDLLYYLLVFFLVVTIVLLVFILLVRFGVVGDNIELPFGLSE